MEIVRAAIFHTPKRLVIHADGALAIEAGRILACGDYSRVHADFPEAIVRDLRGGYVLPGLIDTHVHFPQTRVLGSLGLSLLDWLERYTLPEEARFADPFYAGERAQEFVRALARHGTTTALVFGSHFPSAVQALFEAAEQRGIRVFSGLVLADRNLRPELHQTPESAYRDSQELMRSRPDRYCVMPRFALSATEPMLEVCQTLVREHPSARFTTHINESPREVAEVARLFPDSKDYLNVYERFDLVGRRSVLAHNIHATDSELVRIAEHDASIAHCPHSNAALGSGIFPMQRHLESGVRFALGTDVGGGTGFSLFKEALAAYLMQRVAAKPIALEGSKLLYLATRAGAEALAIEDQTGDFETGKSADFVYIKPPEGTVLSAVIREAESSERVLSAIFTLAEPDSIAEVRVAGKQVWP